MISHMLTAAFFKGSVLGPLLFYISINDLFYFINDAKLSNYVDDNQSIC